MHTLHIQHPITDLDAWAGAFNRFAAVRRDAGVRAERVQHRVGGPGYVVIDLDFDTSDAAHAFLRFLQTQVWRDAPTLAGTPETMILEPVEVSGPN